EVDAAEDDRRGIRRGRLARKAERVPDVVGDVLHLGHLVVMGEDDRVALAREGAHLLLHAADLVRCERQGGHRTSRETSRKGAEGVSAPTETKSTPVAASSRTVSSVPPPEASSSARPPTRATASRSRAAGMLSSRIRSAPAATASRAWSSVSHSTSTAR